jgi:hypothetical protein
MWCAALPKIKPDAAEWNIGNCGGGRLSTAPDNMRTTCPKNVFGNIHVFALTVKKPPGASAEKRIHGPAKGSGGPPGCSIGFRGAYRDMLALNDKQLELVMIAAEGLELEKRGLFLERVAAKLELRGHRFTDIDLEAAIRLALTGLIQSAA